MLAVDYSSWGEIIYKNATWILLKRPRQSV